MALNWTMLDTHTRQPVPLPNEMIITTVSEPAGAELVLTIPNAPPSGSSSSGGVGGIKQRRASGRIWLTDLRFIFVATPSRSGGSKDSSASADAIDTVTVPLHAILSTRFEQPTFGANYLSFEIKPTPGGGLTEGTKGELRFPNRAMFEFVSLLEKNRERAIYMKRQMAEEADEGLPTYTSPAESSSNVGIPVDNPPGYDA